MEKCRIFATMFVAGIVGNALGVRQARAAEPAKPARSAITWHELKGLRLEGRGWQETKSPYDRLPARARSLVRPPVWSLSRHSAGLCARFVTDATQIHARWTLTSPQLAMPHMPATGVSGVDLYVKTSAGKWRWLACGRPRQQTTSTRLVTGIAAGRREFLLYLPLYNGVTSAEIGVPNAAALTTAGPREKAGPRKPIVFYGTSITQGGCASRPGMVHTAILGRRFDRPVINLGFSGNGRMELALAKLMSEVDAAVYVIDCLPNINAAQVAERTVPLVKALRTKRPSTPILLVEDRSYTDSFLIESKRRRNLDSRAALRKAYLALKSTGTNDLYYLEGEHLLGDDGEGTVDSSHPTDLGFIRQADAFQKALEPILRKAASR